MESFTGQAHDQRTKAAVRQPTLTLAARVAVAVVATFVTLSALTANGGAGYIAFEGFDVQTSATIAAALMVACCGALALMVRRNGLLRAELARMTERAETVAAAARGTDLHHQHSDILAEAHEARDTAEAASSAKTRFLALVSHEVRTPLNGILGMADLLADTGLTPEQATYVAAVKTSGETLLSLIEEILDFSKIESGRLDLSPAPFRLIELVEGVVELLGPRAQAKGLEIASAIDERLPERLVGDAARLRQVLLNLAGNAVKFTETGGLAIMVGPGGAPDEIEFRVRDTGIGIAAEAQTRIFGEFEQADSSSTRAFGGTGLGLAISQRIVERMGGRIAVDSRPGAGATFHFTVRLSAPAESAAPPFTAPDLKGQSVLLVASSAVEAPLLAERLRRWGANVRLLPDLAQARAALAEQSFAAIVVDYAIGPDAANALARATAGVARRVVLIGAGDRHALADLQADGFSNFLVKPVRASSLAARFGAQTVRTPAAGLTIGSAVAGSKTPGRLSVLVAEDNEINALLARALLGRLGHNPTMVESGSAAVAAWHAARDARAPFDLVIMDLHMPGTDGLEAARQIRAAEAGGRRTPVIALTANAFAEDREQCLAAGMDGFLTKPLDVERLNAALAFARNPSATPLAA
jgi:signal transduction histidine kinase/DNA-binding response OmpR family regulator